MVTTLYTDFLDAQGQLSPNSVVLSGRKSNSAKLLCMSLLPARIKNIQSNMKSQRFSHYKSMGILRPSRTRNNNKKFRSFNSKENIHKKEVGPYRVFGY